MLFYTHTSFTSILLLIFITDHVHSRNILRKKKIIVAKNLRDKNERLFKLKKQSDFEDMEFGASSKSWGSNYIEDKFDYQNEGKYKNIETTKATNKPMRKLMLKNQTQKPPQNWTQEEDEESALNRTISDSRFLSLFTIVRFKNDICNSSSGLNGTCYSSSDCSKNGGSAYGACASGFGVCCIVSSTCGGVLTNNCSYFQSSGYPSTFNSIGSCQVTVVKCNSNICQMRLDFVNFILAPPEATDQTCNRDQFIVTAGSKVPPLCGTNTGRHIYVDAGTDAVNQITLAFATSGASFGRSFSVRVCQLECNSPSLAPSGCLQYFTGVTGQIQSFNYLNAGGLMLSNTDYAICIRMEMSFCGIQYTACTDSTNTIAMSFSITGGTPALGSVVGDANCITDWITILCATNTLDPAGQSGTPSTCVDRICGMVFNSVTTAAGSPSVPVNSFAKPFVINVHTNGIEGSGSPADTNNRGFCLNYVQQPCTSTG